MFQNISSSFIKELPADSENANFRRQVKEAAFSYAKPKLPSNPELLIHSDGLANGLGLDNDDLTSSDFLSIMSGQKVMEGTMPYAMAYAGHQFGNWAGQLGDGRAINLFDVTYQEKIWTLQLKGAGPTPYSRTADGFAVLRSSIREFLCSEAMYHLGVPTTRALSLVKTGDEVLRDVMYDGNPAYEKGAIVCRVAPSFIRFGNFELFSSQGDLKNLQRLLDYTIKHHYPSLGEPTKKTYLDFFREVAIRTLDIVIEWQRVGFVHGVMNTDNMSILGLTIDYGPYGWIDDFDYGWTPNTTDRAQKRYRFGNQSNIALWNLIQLANAIHPLIGENEGFIEILDEYQAQYHVKMDGMWRNKLGLSTELEGDKSLFSELELCFKSTPTDMTIFFRNLSKYDILNLPSDGLEFVKDAFYQPHDLINGVKDTWHSWFVKYFERVAIESMDHDLRAQNMNKVNPKYVLRNYMAQLSIDEADKGSYRLLHELHELLKNPYEEQIEFEKWFSKRPDWAKNKVGSSMLSCSS